MLGGVFSFRIADSWWDLGEVGVFAPFSSLDLRVFSFGSLILGFFFLFWLLIVDSFSSFFFSRPQLLFRRNPI